MTNRVHIVRADWDAEAQVWFAVSDDVPGLATGADTFEALTEKLRIAVPELLEENGLPPTPDRTYPFSWWRSASSAPIARRDGR